MSFIRLKIPHYERKKHETSSKFILAVNIILAGITDLCFRCEDYAISLLEQCEDLREVETFLQTRCIGTKDANYILAILDAREKFVAHERFQYVLLKKFGELKYLFVN